MGRAVTIGTVGILLLAAVAGCNAAAEDERAGASQQALFGGEDFEGCTTDDRLALRHSMIYGRAAAASNSYRDCLEAAISGAAAFAGPYVACASDPDEFDVSTAARVEIAHELAQSPNSLRISCSNDDNSEGGHATIGSFDHAGPEVFTIQRATRLATVASSVRGGSLASVGLVADTVWHEVMHQRGFNHNCAQQSSLTESLPWIAGLCMGAGVTPCSDASLCVGGRQVAIRTYGGGGACECAVDDGQYTTARQASGPFRDEVEASEQFGQALHSADFDGDGLTDLAVGAPRDNSGKGLVFVHYGTGFGPFPLQGLTPPQEVGVDFASFGWSLASADFNIDGFDDLAIGAPGFASGKGRVYVYFGSKFGLSHTPAQILSDSSAFIGDRFGEALGAGRQAVAETAPFIHSFIVVGAPARNNGEALVFRNQPGTTNETFELRGRLTPSHFENDDWRFGAAIAVAPVLATSFPDAEILIGAPRADDSSGRAYLYDSFDVVASDFSSSPELVLQPETPTPDARFGAAVALGAGHAIVSAPGLGAVYSYGADITGDHFGELRTTLPPETPSSYRARGYGRTLSGPARLFGTCGPFVCPEDEILLVGAPSASGSVGVGGAVFLQAGVIPNHTIELQVVDQTGLSFNEADDFLGGSLSFGDYDGDGDLDVAASAMDEDVGDVEDAGAVLVYRACQAGDVKRLIPWRFLTGDGLAGDNREIIPEFSLIDSYVAGQKVVHECQIYVALRDNDGSNPTAHPEDWASLLSVQALPRSFSFDEASWSVSQGTVSVDTSVKREGAASLRVDAAGFVELSSPEFRTSSLPAVGDKLLVDVYVPASQPPSGYKGAMQLYLTVPSTTIHQYVGQVELTPLSSGDWHTVEFTLPQAMIAALLETHDDARIHISVNTEAGAPDRVRLDFLRFAGTLVAHPDFGE